PWERPRGMERSQQERQRGHQRRVSFSREESGEAQSWARGVHSLNRRDRRWGSEVLFEKEEKDHGDGAAARTLRPGRATGQRSAKPLQLSERTVARRSAINR